MFVHEINTPVLLSTKQSPVKIIYKTNINLLVLINVLIMLIKIGIYRGVALDQTDVQK